MPSQINFQKYHFKIIIRNDKNYFKKILGKLGTKFDSLFDGKSIRQKF